MGSPRRRQYASAATLTMMLLAALPMNVAPPAYAAVAADEDLSGLRLTESTFFVDDNVSLTYDVVVNTPEITQPTTVAADAPSVVGNGGSASSSSTNTALPTTPSTAEGADVVEITPPGVYEPAMIVRVAMHRPLNGESLADVVDGDAGDVIDVVTAPLNRFASRDSATNVVSLNIDVPIQQRSSYLAHLEDVLEYVDPGITPISVSIIRGTTVIAHDVTLIDIGWQYIETAPLTVSTVAQIAGRSTLASPVDSSLSAGDISRVNNELDQLASLLITSRIPISLAFAPELAALLVDGTIAPSEIDVDFDQLLVDNQGELLSLPLRNVDPSAAARAGLGERFATELDAGVLSVQSAFPSHIPTRAVWLVDELATSDILTGQGASLLHNLGFRRLLMADDTYAGGVPHDDLDVTLPGLYAVGSASLPVTIADHSITPAATSLTTATDHAVLTIAHIMERRHADPEIARSIILTSTDFALPDTDVLVAIERMLTDDPTVQFTTASALPFLSPSNRSIVESADPSVDLSQRQLTVDSLSGLINDTGSMLGIDHPLVTRWNELLDDLFDGRSDGTFVVDMIDLVTAETTEVRNRVSVPMSGTVNLTGRDTPLPLIIENSGNEPLTVFVRLNAPRLIVPDEPIQTILLPGTNSLQIPVEARTNGSFAVEIEVLSPAQTPVVKGVTITATAMTLSGFGRLVGVGLILVLVSWWISHLRQQRRQ